MRKITAVAAVLIIAIVASAHAGFEQGETAFTRGDYASAYSEWMPLAVKGDARAQWGIAHLYLQGLGVTQDVELGAEWAKKSAEQGYVEALSLLADMYARGVGVPKDVPKAIQLRNRAAATGDALAQYNLALLHLRGRLVRKDVDAAMVLLKSAARQNLQAAIFNLGVLYFKGEDVPLDLVHAYMWFELASTWKPGRKGDQPVGSMADIGQRAIGVKKVLSARMTVEQITEAKRQAKSWRAEHRRKQHVR